MSQHRAKSIWMVALALALAACGSQKREEAKPADPAAAAAPAAGERPLIEGLSAHSMTITTSSPLAQKYFDQGLRLAYGFNHPEAVRAFEAAEKAGRAAELQRELEELFDAQNQSGDTESTLVPATFLRVTVGR